MLLHVQDTRTLANERAVVSRHINAWDVCHAHVLAAYTFCRYLCINFLRNKSQEEAICLPNFLVNDKMSHIEGQNSQSHESNIENKESAIQIQSTSVFLAALSFACEALISCTKQLNIIDEENGDGNYGSTLAQSANAIKIEMKENRISPTRPSIAFTQISRIIEKESGGLEGGIYSLFFDAAAKSFQKFRNDEQLTADMWLTALSSANQVISEVSGISIGDRSMLDALIPVELKLKDALESGLNPVNAFGKAVEAAETSAMGTLHMPEHRYGFTNRKTFKYPDPGAHAVGIWMRAAYEGIKLKYGCQYDV